MVGWQHLGYGESGDGRNLRSLMKYMEDTQMKDVQKKLQDIGINRLVIVDTTKKDVTHRGEGRDMIYTGDPENDAYVLSEFLSDSITMPYYVEIPFYKYRTYCSSSGCSLEDMRGLEYWKSWVEMFMMSSDPNLKGFYWNLEPPMMFPSTNGLSWEETISELATMIHVGGFEFIWIPYVHTTSWKEIKDLRVFNPTSHEAHYKHHAAYYFDWVFLQPGYYQGYIAPVEISTLQTWKEYVDEAKSGRYNYKGIDNIYYEFECDGAVLMKPLYWQRACDYVRVFGKPSQRAYYYDVNVESLEYLKGVCNYV